MKKEIILGFFIFFLLFGCSTLKFGNQESLYLEEDTKKEIKELDLSYTFKVMGIPVHGSKSIVEGVFKHPDNQTLLFFISFPRIGILRTDDDGCTFTSQFFKLTFFQKYFGYTEDTIDDENQPNSKKNIVPRFFCHFAVSPKDEDKIAIAIGPYIFLSNDNGLKWKEKNIFSDLEATNIRDLFITDDERIIIITDNKIAVSKNWGKSWERNILKINDIPFFKIQYISGYYDDNSKTLFSSIRNLNESHELISKKSYDYFYNNKESNLQSGLYFTKDFGKTWQKTKINVPVVMWEYNKLFYCSSVYPISFYEYKFSDKFRKTVLYKKAKLDEMTPYAAEFVKILFELQPEDYEILSQRNNKIIKFDDIDNEVKIINENNFDNLFLGIKKLQNLSTIQWENYWYEQKKSENLFYEYNFWKLFKLWTGYKTNSPVLYAKNDKNNTYYRIKPDDKFFKVFIKYCVENQIKLNGINPFLKKTTDLEFFNPEIDPTNGFPVTIEYSKNKGKTWNILEDSRHIKDIIDPTGNKRSGFFWYKNVDKRKLAKLQISFGFTEGVNFLVYPMDLNVLDDYLLVRINYFSVIKSYKDLYLVPLK